MEKKVLGKGLSALISNRPSEGDRNKEMSSLEINPSGNVAYVKTISILENRFQPRENYDEAKLEDLKASIKEKGILQPLLVREKGGFFEIIPFLGPILSGALAVASALATSTVLAVYTLIFFLIAQQFESHFLVPLLNRRSVGLHPVIVITAVLIGAEVGGFLGIVIAIPAAAVFQEVITDWSIQKRSVVNS